MSPPSLARVVRACLMLSLLLVARAHAKDDTRVTYARIVVESAALRSGPGVDFRVLQIARREDTFRVRARATLGHWLELELSDGGRAYVQGASAWLYDASEASPPSHARWSIFAPPPLLTARGELSVVLGTLSGDGFLAVRPMVLLAPSFGFELSLGASVGSLGRLLMLGLGGVVNLFPSWPITPFFTVGGGGVHGAPNSDAFLFESGTRSLVYGGGGLRFGFRHRLIVRVEGRGYALFDAGSLTPQQEISGGLSAFF